MGVAVVPRQIKKRELWPRYTLNHTAKHKRTHQPLTPHNSRETRGHKTHAELSDRRPVLQGDQTQLRPPATATFFTAQIEMLLFLRLRPGTQDVIMFRGGFLQRPAKLGCSEASTSEPLSQRQIVGRKLDWIAVVHAHKKKGMRRARFWRWSEEAQDPARCL
jgi:hypothetical protein